MLCTRKICLLIFFFSLSSVSVSSNDSDDASLFAPPPPPSHVHAAAASAAHHHSHHHHHHHHHHPPGGGGHSPRSSAQASTDSVDGVFGKSRYEKATCTTYVFWILRVRTAYVMMLNIVLPLPYSPKAAVVFERRFRRPLFRLRAPPPPSSPPCQSPTPRSSGAARHLPPAPAPAAAVLQRGVQDAARCVERLSTVRRRITQPLFPP